MKRLSNIEKAFLALGVLFIGVGTYSVIHPTEMFVFHGGVGRFHYILSNVPALEHVTMSGARIYGLLSVVFGAAMAWFVFYCPRKR